MKRRFLFCVSLMAMALAPAKANLSGIDVLWEEHGIEGGYYAPILVGYAPDGYPFIELIIDSYSVLSSYPISNPLTTEVSITTNISSCWSTSTADTLSLSAAYDFTSPEDLYWTHAWASSATTLTFSPTYSLLRIVPMWGGLSYTGDGSVVLKDKTTGSVIWNGGFYTAGPYHPIYGACIAGPVDPTHEYTLSLSIWEEAPLTSSYGTGLTSLQIELSSVPAPGAILLGSVGFGLVDWLRRRRTL